MNAGDKSPVNPRVFSLNLNDCLLLFFNIKILKMIRLYWFCLVVILLLTITMATAQERQYFRPNPTKVYDYNTKMEIFTTEDGLSNNKIRVIFQDKFGYIWVGTENGLNKYDGYGFTIYKNIQADSSSLSNNIVTSIVEDIYGNLWIGTKNGLNKLNREKGSFIRYYAEEGNDQALKNSYIKSLLADSMGNLWIDTFSGFFHQYKISENIFISFPYEVYNYDSYDISSLWEDGDKIWILSAGSKAYLFDKIQLNLNTVYEIFQLKKGNQKEVIYNTSIIKDDSGNYYLGTFHSHGQYLDSKKKSISNVGFPSVYVITKNKDEIWYGGFALGLARYNISTNSITLYKHLENSMWSLPNNRIFSLFFDKADNLWMGTENGLAKFNPYATKFKQIFHVAGEESTLIDNSVKDVIQDKDGNIWVATYEGVSKLNHDNNTCEHYVHDDNNSNSLPHNHVESIFEDLNGDIYFAIWAGIGFSKYQKSKNNFKNLSFLKPSKFPNMWEWYNGFVEDKLGNFYAINYGSYMGTYNRKTEKPEYLFTPFSFELLNHEKAFSYYKGRLWGVSTMNCDTLFQESSKILSSNEYNVNGRNEKMFDKDLKFSSTIHNGEYPSDYYTFQNQSLYCITNFGVLRYNEESKDFDRLLEQTGVKYMYQANTENRVWIGTENGLQQHEFDKNTEKLIQSARSINLLKNSKINSLLGQSNGALMIGTNKGLYRYLNQVLDSFALLNDTYIHSMEQSNDGFVWIGTDKGLYQFSEESVSIFTHKQWKWNTKSVNDIFVDKDNDIWIGTHEGLALYLPKIDSIYYYFHNPLDSNSLSNNLVTSITGDEKGVVYVALENHVNTIYKKKKLILRNDIANSNSLQSVSISCALVDKKGQIWVGSYMFGNNVDKIDPATKKITHFVDRPYDSTTYKGYIANCIFQDSKGIIWIGSDKGLNKFDSITEKFTLYTENHGLPSNDILSIQEDANGLFWLGTTAGLVRFDDKNQTFTTFTTKDGISSNNFVVGASTHLANGQLVFGTSKGLTLFDPLSIEISDRIPRVCLTRFYVYDQLFYDDLAGMNAIHLNHSNNNFTIEFSSLDFISPQKIEYVYRLKGYDQNWITVDYKNRRAKYTDLPFGNYVFELKATNEDGILMQNPLELKINITPPWYLTWWAFGFYIIVLVLLVLVVDKFRVRYIKERNRQLEQLVTERAEEIKVKNEVISNQKISEILNEFKIKAVSDRILVQEEERRRISQELHNGVAGHLTGIKIFIENLIFKSNSNEMQILYNDVDRLYNDVRNLSHDLIPPEFENTSIRDVLKQYIDQMMRRTNITMTLSFFPPSDWDTLESHIQVDIYRIVQELMQNAIKHAEATSIDIEILRHDDYVSIMVEDNGKGMKKASKEMGHGLQSLERHLKTVQGSFFIDSAMGRGTIVNIEIPLNG